MVLFSIETDSLEQNSITIERDYCFIGWLRLTKIKLVLCEKLWSKKGFIHETNR